MDICPNRNARTLFREQTTLFPSRHLSNETDCLNKSVLQSEHHCCKVKNESVSYYRQARGLPLLQSGDERLKRLGHLNNCLRDKAGSMQRQAGSFGLGMVDFLAYYQMPD